MVWRKQHNCRAGWLWLFQPVSRAGRKWRIWEEIWGNNSEWSQLGRRPHNWSHPIVQYWHDLILKIWFLNCGSNFSWISLHPVSHSSDFCCSFTAQVHPLHTDVRAVWYYENSGSKYWDDKIQLSRSCITVMTTWKIRELKWDEIKRL